MALPTGFQFSATSLQDYVDCPRRFQLRHLLRIAWPAPIAEPLDEWERHDRLGREFHQLVHRHLLGLPTETLSAAVHDPDLARWWRAYLAYAPSLHQGRAIPEVRLSAPLGGYRLLAQYDVIVVMDAPGETPTTTPGSGPGLLIIDWKTFRQRPARAWLAQRLQTRLYPWLLVQAGAAWIAPAPGGALSQRVEPEQVEMRYWLAEYPQTPEVFGYDSASYQADLEYLTALVTEIAGRVAAEQAGPGAAAASNIPAWPLASEPARCRFCNYRSLCNRGDSGGPLAEYLEQDAEHLSAESLDLDLDWGQVQEMAY